MISFIDGLETTRVVTGAYANQVMPISKERTIRKTEGIMKHRSDMKEQDIFKIKRVYDPINNVMVDFSAKEEIRKHGSFTYVDSTGVYTFYDKPIKKIKI